MHKIEPHLHVSEISPCAVLPAAEMIGLLSDAGYSTVIVTDHCKKSTFDRFGDIPFAEKTAKFFSGYRAAKAAGDKLGINVLGAAELEFVGGRNHYLAYGITEEFMNAHPDFLLEGVEKFYVLARANGILVIQAHPFRDGVCFPTPEHIDGIEVFNSNPRHNDNSELSEKFVSGKNLLVTGGSDAHRAEDIGRGGMLSPYPIESMEDFIRLVRSGEARIFRGEK